MRRIFVWPGFLILLLSVICGAQGQSKAASASATGTIRTEFLPLADLREGMRGTARTVFRGSEPEEFNVEILGIVPGAIGPKQDLIVGRVSGGSADRTSVFAGMSGSPVYINGKLIGAISYSFPFAKEPICGITPIEQMIANFEQKPDTKILQNVPRAVSMAEISSPIFKTNFPGNARIGSSSLITSNSNPRLASVAGQTFQPIATPVTFSGFSQATLDKFSEELLSVGLLPVAAAGGASSMNALKAPDASTLLGGDSVSMQLTRGDFSMAASGTVTLREGEKVYAFGHPFLSLGTADLPMSESHVVTVIPNLNNSFKLAVPDSMVGTMTQDRSTGVFGKLGQIPRMIPIRINLQTSRGQKQTYNYEMATDDFLSPLLLNIGIYNSLLANERALGDSTISLEGEIRIRGEDAVKIERRFTGAQAGQLIAGSAAIPLGAILRSGFRDAKIDDVNLTVESTDGDKSASLERIILDRTEIRPGETFEVQAFLRNDAGEIFVQRIPVTIPKDTPPGTVLVTVGDGGSVQNNSVSQKFVPKNLAELIKTINDIKKSDRLYVQTQRVTSGAIIGAKELPNLPPSVLATLNNDRTAGGFTPTVLTTLTEQEVPPGDYVVSGQQVITIEVKK